MFNSLFYLYMQILIIHNNVTMWHAATVCHEYDLHAHPIRITITFPQVLLFRYDS